MKNAFDFFDISDFRSWSNESTSFVLVMKPTAPIGRPSSSLIDEKMLKKSLPRLYRRGPDAGNAHKR